MNRPQIRRLRSIEQALFDLHTAGRSAIPYGIDSAAQHLCDLRNSATSRVRRNGWSVCVVPLSKKSLSNACRGPSSHALAGVASDCAILRE